MKRNHKSIILLTVLVTALLLTLLTGFRFRNVSSGTAQPVLYQTFPNITCGLDGTQIFMDVREGIITHRIGVSEQFTHPDRFEVTFPENSKNYVYRFGADGGFLGYWELNGGKQTLAITDQDESLWFTMPAQQEEKMNLTLYGNPTAVNSPYSGKYFSLLGDSISSYEGYLVGDVIRGYGPNCDMTVKDMWWYEMARLTGMHVCGINASAGSGVTAVPDAARAGNSDRALQLSSGGRDPDVIFVLLGVNDFFNFPDMTNFKREYLEMTDRLQQAYPAAELILCNYFDLPGEYNLNVGDLNRIISAVASEKGLYLLDLNASKIGIESPQKYFWDYDASTGNGLHPNGAGMMIMGRTTAELLNNRNTAAGTGG